MSRHWVGANEKKPSRPEATAGLGDVEKIVAGMRYQLDMVTRMQKRLRWQMRFIGLVCGFLFLVCVVGVAWIHYGLKGETLSRIERADDSVVSADDAMNASLPPGSSASSSTLGAHQPRVERRSTSTEEDNLEAAETPRVGDQSPGEN